MKYRTVIEIVTEADNASEATDIAGEFLRGDLEYGIEMKCRTKLLRSHILLKVSTVVVVFIAFFGVLLSSYLNMNNKVFSEASNTSVCQPPLKTGAAEDFKKEWKAEENKKVLEYIKNKE